METAFRTLVEEYFSKQLTLDKVTEIINEVYKPVTTTKNVEVVVESTTTTKKEKSSGSNVTRFSAVMLKQLKVDLVKAGVKFSEDKSEEELEKFKKECTKYLNSMDKETYTTKKIQDHIAEFANTKKPKEEEKVLSDIEYKTVQVTLEQLQTNKNLVVVDTKGPQHTFFDYENGQYVTGPDSDDDDDDSVVKKNGKTYYVAKKTGRVYIKTDDKEADVFDGYVGIGKYANLLSK